MKADTPGPKVQSEQDVGDSLEILDGDEAIQRLELKVVARNNSEQAVEGSLRLEAPDGWTVAPQQVNLSLETGGAETVRFSVTVPAGISQGHYPLHYKIRYGQRDYADVLTPVQMAAPGLSVVDGSNCVKEEFIITPAQVMVHLINAQFVGDLRYAYIQGVKDELADILQPFGLTWHLIEDAEMGYIDLSQFDAVVVGHNAYLVRNELRKYAGRFVDYVHQGGTLIVQYQGYGYQSPAGLTPYPINYSQPHDRVTHQDAPVTILDAEHMLFRLPNVIRASDFDDWVRDRGLYFFGQWDKHYHPLLACSDPGEEPKEGGLLICQYGRGTYLYTGYSFFRQLPAAVAGAFRLFANILALPAALILEQTKRRVFQNESVPASEKLVSLFEVDTAIIRRNKAGKPTEFGRKVWLDEVDGGIISDWRLLDGNPSDDTQRSRVCDSTRWHPAIDNHCRTFGKPPVQASADRGVYSSANENYARQKGVRHVVLPKAGYKSQERHAHEKQAWFKRGRRFHAGVEGRTPSRTGTGLGQCSQTQTCLRHLSLSWQSGPPSLGWLDHSGC